MAYLRPHIVHLIGYAHSGSFAFADQEGRAHQTIDWGTLANFWGHCPALVFLHPLAFADRSELCDFRELAFVLSRSIPNVGTFQFLDWDNESFLFGFYQAIRRGRPLYLAIQLARAAWSGGFEPKRFASPIFYLSSWGDILARSGFNPEIFPARVAPPRIFP